MPWTIYCHTHIESGRRYVGLTKHSMMRRWNRHVYSANLVKNGKPALTAHFPNAIRKYGKDAFSHEVLEICQTLESANLAEEKWIEFHKTRDLQFGFNLIKSGSHTPHPIKNPWDRPEFREEALAFLVKANAQLTPKIRSQMTKKLWSDSKFRDKISSVLRLNMINPEIKAKAIEAMKEAFACPESKENRSRSSKAMWTPEYRQKNAELWNDPNFRERCQTGLSHGANLNKNKTHCRNGHEYTKENTYINSKGSRECVICLRKHWKERTRKKCEPILSKSAG